MFSSPVKDFTVQGWTLGNTDPTTSLQLPWCQQEGTKKTMFLLCIRVYQTALWMWARQSQDGGY